MVKVWFKIFFRNSMKNWLNVLVNIFGLTLGLAGLIFVLLYIHDEESYNSWNPHKDNVYRIANKLPNGEVWQVATTGEHTYFLSDLPEVTETMMVTPFYRERLIKSNGKTQFEKKILFAEGNFFDFFPFEPVQGAYSNFITSDKNIAIVEEVAQQFFGDLNPIGQTMDVGGYPFTVTLVYKKPPNSHYSPDYVIQYIGELEPNWGNYNKELFCKIEPGTDMGLLKLKMDSVLIKRFYIPTAETNGETLDEYVNSYGVIKVVPELLATLRLHHEALASGPEGIGDYQLLLILLGLSVLLLLISTVNFVNLSTASATQRAKEVGVKKNLGLSKSELRFQYVLEIVLQGVIALVLALIIVEVLLPYFNEFIDKELLLIQPRILLTVGLITILVTLIGGIVPAIYLSNFKVVDVLKGNFSRSKRGIMVRNGMLGLQFFISGFFLIGVFVIYSQVRFMMTEDAGFNKEQVLVVSINSVEGAFDNYKLAKKVFTESAHVTDVSGSLFVPGHGYSSGTNFEHNDNTFNAASNVIDINYLDFAEIKLLKGRNFSADFSADTNKNILINETAAKLAGIYDDPIGKKVNLGWDDGKNMNIIGMVQDYHVNGFDQKIYPMFMVTWDSFHWLHDWMGLVQFKVKPGHMQEAIAEIESFWTEEIEPEYPFTYSFLDDDFAMNYESYEQQQTMFSILSIIVIITSLLGLFALSTLSIQQRFKEVAIRKTLGASVQEIVFQLMKSFLIIATISLVMLIPISYFVMENWLSNFVYRIEMPIWPYLVAPITLLVLVMLVVGVKALNATKVDLIKYLKFE
jgi:putative ABC transport system permease protein